MADDDLDLHRRAIRLLGYPIDLDMPVRMLVETKGCDEDLKEHTLPAGRIGRICGFGWQDGGKDYWVEIDVPVDPDDAGTSSPTSRFITNTFEEDDGAWPFEPVERERNDKMKASVVMAANERLAKVSEKIRAYRVMRTAVAKQSSLSFMIGTSRYNLEIDREHADRYKNVVSSLGWAAIEKDLRTVEDLGVDVSELREGVKTFRPLDARVGEMAELLSRFMTTVDLSGAEDPDHPHHALWKETRAVVNEIYAEKWIDWHFGGEPQAEEVKEEPVAEDDDIVF